MHAYWIAAVALLMLGARVSACGFIESAANLTTLREEATRCKFVLVATLTKSLPKGDGGASEFAITRVLKTDPALPSKVIRVDQVVPLPDPKDPPRYLLFGDVTDGKLDVYRGLACGPAVADYLAGAMKLAGRDRVRVMGFCAAYLDHADPVIAADAFHEFLRSTDPDIGRAGRAMNADNLRGWLRDEKTPTDRLRLYAFLLAQCGTKDDARLLRGLLDKWVKGDSVPQLDGVLTAYTLLDREAGWKYACGLLQDPKVDFMARYAALRAARYFHTTEPDALAEADRLRAVSLALGHADMADLPIQYLREWRCWKLSAEVFALAGRKGFDVPMIERLLIAYALQCPGDRAAAFVAAARKADPERVRDIEEWLRDRGESAR